MKYSFRAKLWKYRGPASWYFVTLPKKLSNRIRKAHGHGEEGWGRLKTLALIGKSSWTTAIWYDTKAESYLLPVKAVIRKTEEIKVDDRVAVALEIQALDEKKLRWLKI